MITRYENSTSWAVIFLPSDHTRSSRITTLSNRPFSLVCHETTVSLLAKGVKVQSKPISPKLVSPDTSNSALELIMIGLVLLTSPEV